MLHPVCLCLPAACTHVGSPAMLKLFSPILLLPEKQIQSFFSFLSCFLTLEKKINSMSNVGLFGNMKLTISVDLIVRPSWINLFITHTGSNLTTAVRQCCYIYMLSKMMTQKDQLDIIQILTVSEITCAGCFLFCFFSFVVFPKSLSYKARVGYLFSGYFLFSFEGYFLSHVLFQIYFKIEYL